jgi:hypothetical protein
LLLFSQGYRKKFKTRLKIKDKNLNQDKRHKTKVWFKTKDKRHKIKDKKEKGKRRKEKV